MRIRVDAVSKKLSGVYVLKDVDLEFSSGNIYGIVGKNGSGKTMLLRTIIGLIKPTRGQVIIDNQILWKDIDFPKEIGVIIEKPKFLNYLTGFENLKLLAEIKAEITEEQIIDYMRLFSLDPESKLNMKKYSLGMKQKIGIIQAIMENPNILILDEPFNALDEESVEILRKILLKFKNEGKLIILTSHHKEDIEKICNKIVRIESGMIISQN